MQPQTIKQIVSRLAPQGYKPRAEIEASFPLRQVPTGAMVVRSAPSPTGFVHVGTIYMSLLNKRLATQSQGTYILRIEDTDKKREIEGGVELINNALLYFGLQPDEGPQEGGSYGPYLQSQRANLYLSFAIDLLEKGRAYPCFASEEDLHQIYEQQTAKKVRPGYRGEWAVWRGRPESEITAALQADKPFVLRFQSLGKETERLKFKDSLKGDVVMPQNDLDIPLIKSDGLPTYHLAHVVDDYLMRVNLVLRGEEWLSSTPLHLEISSALGIEPFNYAHFAPISIQNGGSKRKLSKRKDPEADILHWQAQGYPPASVLEYLTHLASSGFEPWRTEHPFDPLEKFEITLDKLAMSRAPLLDVKKLDDISKNVIANMSQQEFEEQLISWVSANQSDFAELINHDRSYATKVFGLERGGELPRKDIARWEQASEAYGYFFDEVFARLINPAVREYLADFDYLTRRSACDALMAEYQPNDDQPTWLAKFKTASEKAGFASDMQKYKTSPQSYKGSLADFAKIVRVHMTAKTKTPDLYLVMQTLGPERLKARLDFDS